MKESARVRKDRTRRKERQRRTYVGDERSTSKESTVESSDSFGSDVRSGELDVDFSL